MGTLNEKAGHTEKRTDIVRQAYDVFYKEGFHASGVDSLLKGSGISKRTLYKYFDSKEDLILATIVHYHESALQSISDFVAKNDSGSGDKILLVFDWLEAVLESGKTNGCFAINAKLEFANRDKKIEKACDTYFAKVEDLFTTLSRETKARDPKQAAHQIHILFQGAIVNGQITRDARTARVAKSAAKLILASV